MPESLTSVGAMLAVASGVGTPLAVAWLAWRAKLSEVGATQHSTLVASLEKTIERQALEIERLKTQCLASDVRADAAHSRVRALMIDQEKELEEAFEAARAERLANERERHALKGENAALKLEVEVSRRGESHL